MDPEGLGFVVGLPTREHLVHSTRLLSMIPAAAKPKLRDPSDARAVILALLLSHDSQVRQTQFRQLSGSKEPLLATTTIEVHSQIARCPVQLRLPMVDLCLPALRHLSQTQYHDFSRLIDQMVAADGKMELFEFTLLQVLRRHLGSCFGDGAPRRGKYRSLSQLKTECEHILSSLAHAGHTKEQEAKQAFAQAAERLKEGAPHLLFHPRQECGLKAVRLSLESLVFAPTSSKRRFLGACTHCVSQDGKVTIREGELLRAIADALDCPIPPIIVQPRL